MGHKNSKERKQESTPQSEILQKKQNAFVGTELKLKFTEEIFELPHVLVETSKANNKKGPKNKGKNI